MGDDTLFNTLGSDRCVKTLVVKVRCAWNCETMSTGTLKTEPKHKLSAFISFLPCTSPCPLGSQVAGRSRFCFYLVRVALGRQA